MANQIAVLGIVTALGIPAPEAISLSQQGQTPHRRAHFRMYRDAREPEMTRPQLLLNRLDLRLSRNGLPVRICLVPGHQCHFGDSLRRGLPHELSRLCRSTLLKTSR